MKNIIKKISVLTFSTLLICSLNSEAAPRSSGTSSSPDFIINQRVQLNNIQDEITKVEMKCAVTCRVSSSDLSLGWKKDFFENRADFIRGKKVAGLSQTVTLNLNNGAINTIQRFTINVDISSAKKEHVNGYVCALGYYQGSTLITTNIDLAELSYHPARGEQLPAGIQNLPRRDDVIGQINNLHNPSNFQSCEN